MIFEINNRRTPDDCTITLIIFEIYNRRIPDCCTSILMIFLGYNRRIQEKPWNKGFGVGGVAYVLYAEDCPYIPIATTNYSNRSNISFSAQYSFG